MPFDSAADADAVTLAWGSVPLPEGTVLWMRHAGAEYEASVVDGAVLYAGQPVTPNGFALAVTGRPTNAWTTVWIRRPGDSDFVLADDARAASRGEMRPARARPAARVAAAPKRAVLSLVPFLVRAGGLRDERGDVKSILGGSTRTRPGLISGRGMEFDRALALAIEAGYFPEAGAGYSGREAETLAGALASAGRDACVLTDRDLLDAIDWELRGRLCWPEGLAPEVVSDADREEADRLAALADDAASWRALLAAAAGGPDAALAFLAARGALPAAPAEPGSFEDDCPF